MAAETTKIKIGDKPDSWVILKAFLDTLATSLSVFTSLFISHLFEPVSVCLFTPRSSGKCLKNLNSAIVYIILANMFFYVYIISV